MRAPGSAVASRSMCADQAQGQGLRRWAADLVQQALGDRAAAARDGQLQRAEAADRAERDARIVGAERQPRAGGSAPGRRGLGRRGRSPPARPRPSAAARARPWPARRGWRRGSRVWRRAPAAVADIDVDAISARVRSIATEPPPGSGNTRLQRLGLGARRPSPGRPPPVSTGARVRRRQLGLDARAPALEQPRRAPPLRRPAAARALAGPRLGADLDPHRLALDERGPCRACRLSTPSGPSPRSTNASASCRSTLRTRPTTTAPSAWRRGRHRG